MQDTTREKIVKAAKNDPFASQEEIANRCATTVGYVRTALSEADVSLRKLRKDVYLDLKADYNELLEKVGAGEVEKTNKSNSLKGEIINGSFREKINEDDHDADWALEKIAELKEKKQQKEDLKTYSLPAGKLQFRKQRPNWKYHEEMLVSQLKKKIGRDELVQIKKSVDKRKLKKEVEVVDGQVIDPETGEIIKGVEVQERGEKFMIKIND